MHKCGLHRIRHWRSRLNGVCGERGATLIELLLASFIGVVVVGAAFELYLTQHRNWVIQDEITDAQQSARASIKMLSKHIRMAGHALPEGADIDPIIAINSDPDTMLVVYQPGARCNAPIEHDMPQPSAELRCDGHDISCFEEGALAYIYDPLADIGEFFIITEVQAEAAHIQHNIGKFTRKYPMGSHVFMIKAFRFYIDDSDTLHPTLIVEEIGQQPEPFADNIEDLQFRFVMQNGDTLDVPNQVNLVRRVLIGVTARTGRTDLQFEGEYRRREFDTEVQVRNLDI